MKQSPSIVRTLPALILAGFVGIGQNLVAQTAWNGGGDGTSWGSAANWSSGVPTGTAQITFGNNAPDAAQTIDLGVNRTITTGGSILLNSTGNRDYTLTGGKLTLNRDGNNVTFINNAAGTTTLTIDSDIDLTYTSGSGTTQYTISGTNASARTVNLNGTITGPGTDRLTLNSTNLRLNLRGNNTMGVFTITSGEVVAYHANATGGGQLQGGSGTKAILSLASNLTLGSNSSTSTFLTGNVDVRIREDAPASVDRIITFASRVGIGNVDGKLSVVDNINSTGRVILNMATTTGATVQNLPINLGSTGLLRFSQIGATIYGGSGNGTGIISGAGDVELTGGGTTSFTALNTYTGTTTLTNGSTLSLSAGGTIQGTSRLNLATGTTFNISAITATGYTFGAAQTVAGTGTIVTGGKNLTIQGALAPGNSPGTLNFNLGAGTLFLDSTASFQFELGPTSDLINLSSGTLDVGSGLIDFDNFSFTALGGFTTGQYTLFQTTNAILGSLGPVTSGTFDGYFGELEISGNNLLLNVSVIPEPSSVGLLLLGASVFLFRRGRR